jgi:hypothetical protein
MTEFVPRGYLSVGEAVDHLGREQFPSAWTGKEHSARTGLIGVDEWLRIKDVPPARGSGAPAKAPHRKANQNSPHRTGDPSSESYQIEYQAGRRYEAARDRLRVLLEGGELQAAVLDPFTGKIHPVSTTVWRRPGADQVIKTGRATIPHSPNRGSIIIKEFRTANTPTKPMPPAKIREVIRALREEMAKKSLTRPQQALFVRKKFAKYRVTERQLRQIYQSLRCRPEDRKKSLTRGMPELIFRCADAGVA